MSIWKLGSKYIVSDISNGTDKEGEGTARSRAVEIYNERGSVAPGHGFPSSRGPSDKDKKLATELIHVGNISPEIGYEASGAYSKKQLERKIEEIKKQMEKEAKELTDALANL